MTPEEMLKLKPLSEWHVQLLRITAFHESFQPLENIVWQDITGKVPDNQIKKAKEPMIGEEGEFLGNNLLLQHKPNRIDLIFRILNIPIIGKGIPSLGLYQDKISKFVDLGKKLFNLDTFPPITRLAFGTIVHLNVVDRKAGYSLLNSYLKNVQVDADNSSDFSYRINHPTIVEIDSKKIQVNRLSIWVVPVFQVIGPLNVDIKSSPKSYGLQIELDINTDKDYPDKLPQDKKCEILDKFTEIAQDIIVEGEPK